MHVPSCLYFVWLDLREGKPQGKHFCGTFGRFSRLSESRKSDRARESYSIRERLQVESCQCPVLFAICNYCYLNLFSFTFTSKIIQFILSFISCNIISIISFKINKFVFHIIQLTVGTAKLK